MKPQAYSKKSAVNGMERALERGRRERKLMGEIFFEEGAAPAEDDFDASRAVDYWKDRVSKDLGVPWHRVGVEQFEEWARRGFKKAKRGEYVSFSAEEKERMGRLHQGSSLRK